MPMRRVALSHCAVGWNAASIHGSRPCRNRSTAPAMAVAPSSNDSNVLAAI
jgi:hypothetical protein